MHDAFFFFSYLCFLLDLLDGELKQGDRLFVELFLKGILKPCPSCLLGESAYLEQSLETTECRCNSLSCPPGQLAPRGQAIPGYLAPHPGYLHPRGASCPGRFILPPPTQVKIYVCYFVIFLYHFNEFRSYTSLKVRNWCLWG